MAKDKQELFNYLQTQHLMALATCGEKMWIASVYYAVDSDFNFYFVSGPKSQHCLDIAKNPEVSVAIADSHQPNASKAKIGVQMRGRAELLSGLTAMKAGLDLWNKLNPGVESIVNLKNIQAKTISSRVYKIKPEVIKLFGMGEGDEKQQIFNF